MTINAGAGRKVRPLTVAISLLTLTAATSVIAQDDANQNDEGFNGFGLEEVQVVGIRQSIESAIDQKNMSDQIMDMITAEDIGQLPDNNIAEALRRVQGVQITTSGDGEGDTLQIRGMPNNSVTINGAPVAVGFDRVVSFSDFSAGLFSGLEVFKTARADKVEGGVGGSVNLKTRRPTSLKKPTASITLKQRYSESTEEWKPQGTFFAGNNWKTDTGKFGALFQISTNEAQTRADTARINGYRAYEYKVGKKTKDVPFDVNGDGVLDTDDNFVYPSAYGVRAITKDTKQVGINLAFDWKVNKNWGFMLEGSRFDKDQIENNINYEVVSGRNSVVTVDDPTNPVFGRALNIVDGEGNVVPLPVLMSGSVTKATVRFGNTNGNKTWVDRENVTTSYGFTTQYKSDNIKVEAKYNYSEADAKSQLLDMDYSLGAVGGYDYDLLGGGERGVWTFTHNDGVLDPTDASVVDRDALTRLRRTATDRLNTKQAFRIDLTHTLDFGALESYKVGLRTAEDVIETTARYQQDGDKELNDKGKLVDRDFTQEQIQACVGAQGIKNFAGGETAGFIEDWLSGTCTFDQAGEVYAIPELRTEENFRQGNINKVTEELNSAYAMINFDHEIGSGGMGISGNVGVRYSEMTVTSKGFDEFPILDADGNLQREPVDEEGEVGAIIVDRLVPVDFEGKYNYLLPSLNVNFKFTPDMFLRFGAGKTIQPAAINDLRPNTDYTITNGQIDGITYEAQRGNPSLKPKEAIAYDLSWEWYFAKGGLVTVAPFYKDWQVNTDRVIIQERYNDEVINVRVPENIDAKYGDQKGIEFGYNQAFVNLPGFLEHTGISANYTMVDIEKNPEKLDVEGEARAFRVRISDDSYNLALWYDDGRLSTRLAYNWRAEYEIGNVAINNDGNVVDGASGSLTMIQKELGLLDFSLNYEILDNLKANFSIENVLGDSKGNFAKYSDLERGISWGGTHYNVSLKYSF